MRVFRVAALVAAALAFTAPAKAEFRVETVNGSPEGRIPIYVPTPLTYDPVFDAFYGTSEKTAAFPNGSVFSLTRNGGGWDYRTIWVFDGVNGRVGTAVNGREVALTVDPEGNIYGVSPTSNGVKNPGAVFKLTRSAADEWAFSVAHKFYGPEEQGYPVSRLVLADDGKTIYGTAYDFSSGHRKCRIFKLKKPHENWRYTILRQMDIKNYCSLPEIMLSDKGSIYGVKSKYLSSSYYVWSEIYSFNPKSKAYKTLYRFAGPGSAEPRAWLPAGLIKEGKQLYGVSFDNHYHSDEPRSLVFRINVKNKNFKVLRRLTEKTAPLVSPLVRGDDGGLYGVSLWGPSPQASDRCDERGCGSIVKLVKEGPLLRPKVLYRFRGYEDGLQPHIHGPLAAGPDGRLYGLSFPYNPSGERLTSSILFSIDQTAD